jgi:hypothetical protein
MEQTAVATPLTKTVEVKESVAEKSARWAKEGKCITCGKDIVKSFDGQGSTCKKHEGLIRRNSDAATEPPKGWLRMSDVCRKAVAYGLTIGSVVQAAGGDAATDPLLDPMFRVVYVGRGKWMDPRVITEGFKLIEQKRAQPKETVKPAVAAAPKASTVSATASALKAVIKK